MTANQIAYQRNLEDRRYHQATERLGQRELAEKNRSARAQEEISRRTQAADEAYKLASSEIQRKQLAEAARHNAEVEMQARRNQVLGQDLSKQQFSTSTSLTRRQQDLEKQFRDRQLEISALQQREAARSNLAQEMLQRARNDEQMRHNAMSEQLSERQQSMSYAVSTADRMSRERIAASGNATSTTNTIISGLFRAASSGKGLSSLASLIFKAKGGK